MACVDVSRMYDHVIRGGLWGGLCRLKLSCFVKSGEGAVNPLRTSHGPCLAHVAPTLGRVRSRSQKEGFESSNERCPFPLQLPRM
jgi:hypothetical protein